MKRPLRLPTKKVRERVESKLLWNEARMPEQADFFTFGYEGRKLEELLDALQSTGVKTLLDVRYTPLSMYRPELSRNNFSKRMKIGGITYIHCPHWGVPKDIRARAISTGTRDSIWEWYDSNVIDRYFKRNLHWFLNLEHPTAMMCMEHDPEECHRHRIFMALEKQGLQGYDL